jgi:hypothetical protein
MTLLTLYSGIADGGFLRVFVVLLHLSSNIPGQYLAYATITSLQILSNSCMDHPRFQLTKLQQREDDYNIQANKRKVSRNVKGYTRLNKIT